jgi:apolipoprotein D and lipocalin family protein
MSTLKIGYSGALILIMLLSACSSLPPMKTVKYVNLDRFMGDWYVIANIPTFIEKEAFNAVESYRPGKNGTVETTFRFRKGAFDGPVKVYEPTGFIRDNKSNALWGMQFIWPIKADYRITHLDQDYTHVVIAREARDYVWLMSRQPEMADTDYQGLREMISELGYDVEKLQRIPQQWPEMEDQ